MNTSLICLADTMARLHRVYWPLGQHSRAQGMFKMERMRTLLGFGFLAIVLLLLGAPARADESLTLTLVPVNDLPRADDVADRGGLAKLATIIKNERAAG